MGVAPTGGYTRQQRPGGTAPLPGTTPEAEGAGIGEAGARFGASLHQDNLKVDELELRRRRDAEAARAGRDLAQLDADMRAEARDMRLNRRNAEGEALGHTEAYAQSFDTRAEQYLGTIQNEQVRNTYSVRLEEMRTRDVDEERGWERGQRAGAQGSNYARQAEIEANNLSTGPLSEQRWRDSLTNLQVSAMMMTTVPQEVRDAAIREQQRNVTAAFVNAGIEQDPGAALALIRGGMFNEQLSPEQIARFTDVAQGELHAREAQARQEQAAAVTQFREDVGMLDRRFTDDDPGLTDADLEQMQERARTLGIGPEVYDLGKYRVRLQTRRAYRTTNAVGLRQALGVLDSRIQAAGDRAAPEDVIRRTEIEAMLERRMRIEQQDPLRVSGVAYAPLDGSPQSIRRRVAAATAAERETGHFQYFTPQELPRLQELAASGPAGRLQAANEVAAVGVIDGRAGDRAARQILPTDATFRIAVRLGPVMRAQVLRGAEARRQMPQQLTLADGSHRSFDDFTQRWFQINIAPQLRGLNPEDVNGVLEAARSAYAERARAHGNLASASFDQSTFSEAVSDVLGRTNLGGGTGYWDFGANGQALTSGRRQGIVLPTRMTQQRLDTVMTWLPIARLGERFPAGSTPNGGPRWANGSVPSSDDVRGRFVPVMVDDGVYEFHGADGSVLGSAAGGHFRLDVYKLEAHGAPRRPGAPPPSPELLRDIEARRRAWDQRGGSRP
jgi:hypothetical protein